MPENWVELNWATYAALNALCSTERIMRVFRVDSLCFLVDGVVCRIWNGILFVKYLKFF